MFPKVTLMSWLEEQDKGRQIGWDYVPLRIRLLISAIGSEVIGSALPVLSLSRPPSPA